MGESQAPRYTPAYHDRTDSGDSRRIVTAPAHYVVDSSVLSKIFLLDEEHAEHAAHFLRLFVRNEIVLSVPTIALYEVGSSVLKAVRRRRLTDEAAVTALQQLSELGLHIIGLGNDADIVRRAFPVARELGRSLYDAAFLVVADAVGARLVTADRPLHDAAESTFGTIWLPNFPLT